MANSSLYVRLVEWLLVIWSVQTILNRTKTPTIIHTRSVAMKMAVDDKPGAAAGAIIVLPTASGSGRNNIVDKNAQQSEPDIVATATDGSLSSTTQTAVRVRSSAAAAVYNEGASEVAHEEGSNPLHICRQQQLRMPDPKANIDIWLECAGPEYDAFGARLLAYAENETDKNWGRRPSPLPDNKSVLFFGNSHTRQTFHALLCQYANQVVHTECLTSPCFENSRYTFKNNSTLTLIANNPMVYSRKWLWMLQKALGPVDANSTSLEDSVDAIILGTFNNWKNSQKYQFP